MKKKILLISDDIRGSSGVSHISQKIILNTVDKFDWVQLSALKSHPENNLLVDVSKSVGEHTGVTDPYVRLYPYSGYGDEIKLQQIIDVEKPDAILHFSDPHNFSWLYQVDHHIRSRIPLIYYHVWDNDPVPHFNKKIYLSCDYIGCISRKTHEIVSEVCNNEVKCDYIPHGISDNVFFKIDNTNEINKIKERVLGASELEFVVFSNNVNIPRKQLPNLLQGYDRFSRKHDLFDKSCLLMHNNPSSVPSDNLQQLVDSQFNKSNVLFSTTQLTQTDLNQLYNISDVVVNCASNEGFGLSTLEALMTSTPIIATDTGGLHDQMFVDNKCGNWAFPLYPDIRSINSSNHVPYIYDDICTSDTICEGLEYWYNMSKEKREKCGNEGMNYVRSNFNDKKMTESLYEKITETILSFEPLNTKKILKI